MWCIASERLCTEFLEGLEDSLSLIIPTVGYIICMGDFNINLINTVRANTVA